MENQPTTGRTWFRLTSLGRGDTQPQTTQPAQEPPASLPTIPKSRMPFPTTKPPVQPLPAPQPQPQPPRTPTPPQPQLQPQQQPLRTPTPPQPQVQAPRAPTPPQTPRTTTPTPQPTTTLSPSSPQPLSPIKTPGSLRSLTQQEPTATESAAIVEAQQQPVSQVSLLPQSVLAPALRAASRTPTPPQSPKVIKTPLQSPKVIKTFSPTPPQTSRTSRAWPPAALIANPEPEPKPMQMPAAELKGIRTTSNGSSVPLNPITETTAIDHPPPEEERKALDTRNPPPTSKDDKRTVTQTSKKVEREISIINIAGENMGAYMEVGYRKPGQKQQNGHGGLPAVFQASNPRTRDEKASDKKGTKAAAENAKPMASLVNSNVQCLNNSLLFNSSCTQQNPGVHITLSRSKPKSSNTTAHSSSA